MDIVLEGRGLKQEVRHPAWWRSTTKSSSSGATKSSGIGRQWRRQVDADQAICGRR